MTTIPADVARAHLRITLLLTNEVVRRGLDAMLRGLPPVHSVSSCSRLAGLDMTPRTEELHVVVTTTTEAPALSAVAADLRRHLKVLVVVDAPSDSELALLTTLAPDGVLNYQDLTLHSLDEAIGRIAAGELPMPASITRRLLARAGGSVAPRTAAAALTARETATLTLLADGLSNKQIAKRLKVSEHGAKRLVTGVLLKLGAPNRTTAVVTAIRMGLIDYA